ncbi:mitochondrial carrier domain-containing protein [Myxozyma melibiosi]|uniref:Mitochondrial glycine transporter n=1 Tax=Myxozyma melibiosi TaxID=54550 RepID=A0ABR1F407_9ASCO
MTTLSSAASVAPEPSSKSLRIVSGFVSGFASSILLQPLDLLKTRVQQAPNSSLRQTLREITSLQQPSSSPLNLALIPKLWRGTVPSVLRTSVGSGLYFSALHSIRAAIHDNTAKTSKTSPNNTAMRSSVLPELHGYANLFSGSFTRGAVGFIMMPITVLKVRYESTRYARASLLDTVKSVYKENGIRGFFYGFGATFVRDVPYAGLYVSIYEHAKAVAPLVIAGSPIAHNITSSSTSNVMSSPVSASVNGICAALAATLATTVTNPFDAVKTRMQLFPDRYGTKMWTAFARMAREESGIRGLFDGLSLRIVRKGFSSAIAWSLYEEMVRRS